MNQLLRARRKCHHANRFFAFVLLAAVSGWPQTALPVTAGQEQSPGAAARAPAAPTRSGGADGVWSPNLNGERRPLYRLRKSDIVQLSFTFAPEFDQLVGVQPDGYIPLKGLSELYAEGFTVPQLREAVTQAYSATLHQPEVTVVLKDFDKPYFIAGGEVARPGKYELRADTTLTEAVTIAGGFTEQARHSQVVLFRRVSDELVESRVVDLKSMLKSRNLNEDMHLQPGDLVFVPQNTISKLRRYLPSSSLNMYLNPMQF